ncbi:homeobox protein cut-like 1 [Gorilla gorilla gorilla]|uniref:homeobox protein cut-like 1 n=1 Tax=Gorilla gorilla gorilla TaxID=9595 RepID=UPI002445A610|nr:homeobox protein cut-like 1 [Gorilla gorilla gorilla]
MRPHSSVLGWSMGLGAMEQGSALVREARAAQEPTEPGEAQAWRAAGPKPCPTRRQLRPREKLSTAPAGPGATPLTARGGGAPPAAPSAGSAQPTRTRNSRWPGTRAGPELALARNSRWPGTRAGPELALARNSRWRASTARSRGSRPRFSLHTSSQAEGAGSGLGQPRKGFPQCSGGLKGSSSAAKVGAQAEEAPRARAVRTASTLSPLNII